MWRIGTSTRRLEPNVWSLKRGSPAKTTHQPGDIRQSSDTGHVEVAIYAKWVHEDGLQTGAAGADDIEGWCVADIPDRLG
jgi:hypothetical protein